MVESLIIELSLILGIAAVLALIGRVIKQPPLIAYLVAGILVGPLAFNILSQADIVHTLARIGIAFLLFIVGLNLDFRVLKEVGSVSFVVGIGQIAFTAVIGFFIAIGLGFDFTPALYLAAALAFSSTVVVVKLLSDKNELDTLHGKISIGVLIVQDFVAALVLMIVPVLSGGSVATIAIQLGSAALLIAGLFVFAYIFLPGALSVAAKHQEVLFLFSVGWALLIAVLFDYLGFSLEIGALLAGMALASSKYNLEIRGKIKGIRDFFVVMFFVFFGSQLVGPLESELLLQAAMFSVFIVFGIPIIVMALMRGFGYRAQTSFFTGVNIAQISEFSLILILLGFTTGALSQEMFSLVILIALFTIALSSYTIYYARPLFKFIEPLLKPFDGKGRVIGSAKKHDKYDIIMFGYNRIGFNLLKAFEKGKKKYLLIDYNPKTIKELSERGVNCLYGDANDVEFLSGLKLNEAKTIISTIPIIETNMTILKHIKNNRVVFLPTSHHIRDTRKLYMEGADYVIMPHFLGGDYVAHMLLKDKFNKKMLDREGRKHLRELNERLHQGHDHPRRDFHGR